jgi:hypothetical protein
VIVSVAFSTPLNTESDLKWIRWDSNNKKFPRKSVVGGKSVEGRDLYVIRVLRRNTGDGRSEFIYGSCGGKDGRNLNDCFIATESKEQQVYDVEVSFSQKVKIFNYEKSDHTLHRKKFNFQKFKKMNQKLQKKILGSHGRKLFLVSRSYKRLRG